jgi:hypothetical protein
MAPGVELAIAIALPTAIGGALVGGARAWRWAVERRRNRRPVPVWPIERVGADLRRLRTQLELLENQEPRPGKALRVRALRAAYADALVEACQRLEVDVARPEHYDRAAVYRIEAALRGRGLDVRASVSP